MLHKDFLDRVDVSFAWGLIERYVQAASLTAAAAGMAA